MLSPSDFQEAEQTSPKLDKKKEPKGLELLRKSFPANQISRLCKPTSKDNQPGRCKDCGGWHKIPSVALDYVGHAALTDRLLDADPSWSWEPMALNPNGTPFLDGDGGMWIKLTVCGVTRLGYGDAQGKSGGNATKERIGDALRNAAMRFGAALDLWHKGDLHAEADDPEVFPEKVVVAEQKFQERAGGEQASPAMVKAFQEMFSKSGKTEAQLASILKTRYSATRVWEVTKEELQELVKWAAGKEGLEDTLRTSVTAATGRAQEAPVASGLPSTPPDSPQRNVGRLKVSEKQIGRLYAIAKAHSVSEPDVHQYIKETYGYESTKDLDRTSYDEVCKWLESQ